MPHMFDASVVAAVRDHMNGDHAADNLLIVRAHGGTDATDAAMVNFDGDGGEWVATLADGSEHTVRVAWRGGPIRERSEVRREIVALYDEACTRLGVEPRPHE